VDGLAFRDVAADAIDRASRGVGGALAAANDVLEAAAAYKKAMKGELEGELAPFLDEKGRPEDVYRGAIRRIEVRFARRERRAERDHIDRVLLAGSALLRDRLVAGVRGDPSLRMNIDRTATGDAPVTALAAAFAALEEARAELADDVNRNPKLVLEHAFLRLAQAFAAAA
jgi:hypothetical protein